MIFKIVSNSLTVVFSDFKLLVNISGKWHWETALLHEIEEVSESSLEQVSYGLWMFSDILLPHECELWILDELTEADHQTPWVGAAGLETLQEDLADLLLDDLAPSFGVDEEDDAGEDTGELGSWWTEIQELPPEQRLEKAASMEDNHKRPKRIRKRRPNPAP